ncbi:hypothetical protein acsn021_12940 [Anaerocolumna cellulosilytica]|uniref:Uncharacterized protein n=1 Tax=Anaerocolumna cellulosilytica TaxID=433286 RepID=A0A6S6R2H9_9FIRM|nr:SH3 domain-containing C40 family peptidase [Anaerocolumna cellulosilytica]MBB5195977.1 hypothetical protein [Anaerocolumna cellulosilytica]BCJ93725.1 hypothetical protein acsn021_12940 [Anaerocolumna cellulosilytica]
MKYALVNATLASLRKEPDRYSELVDENFYGRKVEILKDDALEWFFVKTEYRYTGYVHKSQLIIGERLLQMWDKYAKMIVIQAYADVLDQPKIQGFRITSLTRGALVAVLDYDEENGWVKIALCDGRNGYIKRGFLADYITDAFFIDNYYNRGTKETEDALRKSVVEAALSYLGTQYRWGGKSPLGIDCSGLCSVAYLLNGVIIYRDSAIMPGFPIHEVPYEAMKTADLLYFPGHIAMYIGEDRYVHATAKSGSDGVVINSLNPCDPDYREDLPEKITAVGSLFYSDGCE